MNKKRDYIKIGDIFAAEISKSEKVYFQYIFLDKYCLGSDLIRVFEKKYPIDSTPDIEEIISDRVLCYSHAVIYWGIEAGAWNKVGSTRVTDLKELENVYFCGTYSTVGDALYNSPRECYFHEWKYWNVYKEEEYECTQFPILEGVYEDDVVHSYSNIIERMKYGYNIVGNPLYNFVKRIPRPDVDSYVVMEIKGRQKYDTFNEITYESKQHLSEAEMIRPYKSVKNVVVFLHFYGADIIREIILLPNGKIIKFDQSHKKDGNFIMDEFKFWDVNWNGGNFIQNDDFEYYWNL